MRWIALLLLGCGAHEPLVERPAPVAAPIPDDVDGDAVFGDGCPCEPEDVDGFQDEDGCPDPDDDGDRIVDACDVCPREPETYQGIDDLDGCPDQSVCVFGPAAEVAFSANLSAVDVDRELAPLLDALGQADVLGVTLQGSTVDGEPDELGPARCELVRALLVQRGVDPASITVSALGIRETRRVCSAWVQRQRTEAPSACPDGPPPTSPAVCRRDLGRGHGRA